MAMFARRKSSKRLSAPQFKPTFVPQSPKVLIAKLPKIRNSPKLLKTLPPPTSNRGKGEGVDS